MLDTKIKLKDYVVIDVETPNKKSDSICQIAIIQVRDNEVVLKKSALINPEDKFDDINMKIHKITPDQVKDAITIDLFWEEIKDIITNNIIIGHGIKFDISVITKALMKYGIELPVLKIVCTQHLSQKNFEIDKYRLDSVCEFLGFEIKKHHDALEDTKACLEIFEYINENIGLADCDIEEYLYEKSNHEGEFKIAYTDNTKSLQELKQIIEYIMIDGNIEEKEIRILSMWINDNMQLAGNYPFDKISDIINKVLEDGIILENEYTELSKVFDEFINPLKCQKKSESIIFENKVFCLTGTFDSGSKEDIEQKIIAKGGLCGKGVTSKTNYLIVGGSGSDAWKFGNYGGKVQKAMELIEKGKDIKIIAEDEFINGI